MCSRCPPPSGASSSGSQPPQLLALSPVPSNPMLLAALYAAVPHCPAATAPLQSLCIAAALSCTHPGTPRPLLLPASRSGGCRAGRCIPSWSGLAARGFVGCPVRGNSSGANTPSIQVAHTYGKVASGPTQQAGRRAGGHAGQACMQAVRSSPTCSSARAQIAVEAPWHRLRLRPACWQGWLLPALPARWLLASTLTQECCCC